MKGFFMKKKVIITGASRGIGRSSAIAFAEAGDAVVLGYRSSEEQASSLAKELRKRGAEVLPLYVDVSNTASVKLFFEKAFLHFGRIDVLVNNAGIARQQLLTDVTDEDWKEIMETNAGGVFRCCREVVPYFLQHHSGCIVNVSSMWGISGASCESVYSASKSAVIGFTKALAKELGPSGIRVNCVAPGVIDTDMNAALSAETKTELADMTPLGRIGRSEEVANVIRFLATEEASFVTGQTLTVDGGFLS